MGHYSQNSLYSIYSHVSTWILARNICLKGCHRYVLLYVASINKINKNYIGLAEGTFKQRYYKHNLSFRDCKYAHSTELSKHIWQMRDTALKGSKPKNDIF